HLRARVVDRPGPRERGSRDDGRRRDLRADRRRVVDGERGWPKGRVQLAVPDITLPDHGPRFVDAGCDAELAEGPEVPHHAELPEERVNVGFEVVAPAQALADV